MTHLKTISLCALASIFFFTACKKDDFEEQIVLCPKVESTDPADQAANVATTQIISVEFNRELDPATINTNSIIIEGVSGAVSYSGVTATFTPSVPLAANSTFIGRVKTSVKDVQGSALEEEYVWTFSTGTHVTPRVTSTNPANSATDVLLNSVITASFSESMNPATFNSSSFLLMDGASEVSGVVTYNGLVATFTPDSDLELNTIYTATITTAAENYAGVGLPNDFTWSFTTDNSDFNPMIDLGSVSRFGIISGTGVSNMAGPSQINDMDIGISPGFRSAITGFSLVDGGAGVLNNGNFYAADDSGTVPSMLFQAKNDLSQAFLTAEGVNFPSAILVAGDLGGRTLAPGIYKSNSTLTIQNGNLTLDGQGDPNAEWIFQIPSSLTTFGGSPFPSPTGGNVVLTGGARASNVTWQVGSSATIGDYTSFNGNILALTSVTMNSFSQTNGRILASNGAVTLTGTNIINKP